MKTGHLDLMADYVEFARLKIERTEFDVEDVEDAIDYIEFVEENAKIMRELLEGELDDARANRDRTKDSREED